MILVDNVLVILYLLSLPIIGLIASKRNASISKFVVGNKQFTVFAIMITVFMTIMDGEALFHTVSQGFKRGLSYFFVTLAVTINVILYYFISLRVSKHSSSSSQGDIIEKAFGRSARILAGCCWVLSALLFAANQFILVLQIFDQFFNISSPILTTCLILFIFSYAAIGGITAITAVHIFQFAIFINAIPLVCNIALGSLNGLSSLIINTPSNKLNLQFLTQEWDLYIHYFLVIFMPLLSPPITNRMLLSDRKNVGTAFLLVCLLIPIFYFINTLIGLSTYSITPKLHDYDAYSYIIKYLVPNGLKGFVIAGLLAAILTSIDAYVHSASIGIALDIVKPLSPNYSQRKLLSITRISTILMIIFSLIIGQIFHKPNFQLMFISYQLWGPIIMPSLMLYLFSFRITKLGFYLGIVNSAVVMVLYYTFSNISNEQISIYAISANFLTLLYLHFKNSPYRLVDSKV